MKSSGMRVEVSPAFNDVTQSHTRVGTDHSGRSPVPAAPALVWFGSDSSAGGSSAWASHGPPRCPPPSRLSVAVSLASPRSPSPMLKEKGKKRGGRVKSERSKWGRSRRAAGRKKRPSVPESRGRFVGVQSVPWAVSVDDAPADGKRRDVRQSVTCCEE